MVYQQLLGSKVLSLDNVRMKIKKEDSDNASFTFLDRGTVVRRK